MIKRRLAFATLICLSQSVAKADSEPKDFETLKKDSIVSMRDAIDTDLKRDFNNTGAYSIAAGMLDSLINLSSLQVVRGHAGTHFQADRILDFSPVGLAMGAVKGAASVVARRYLKTPLDYLSYPFSWLFYKLMLLENKIFYKPHPKEEIEYLDKYFRPVVDNLLDVVEKEFGISKSKWDINLLNSAAPNAFATSGYRIAVFPSIFTPAKNQAGLACVIGHEIGHVLAKHMGQIVASHLFLGGLKGAPLIATLGIQRAMETQADEIGIHLSTLAGYDPKECPQVWHRMTTFAGDRREIVNFFLSTHPTHASRVVHLQKYVKQLSPLHEADPYKIGLGETFDIDGSRPACKPGS